MTTNIPDVTGKVAFVTGAGSGIGRASSMALAERGAIVAVCDIAESRHETVKLIEAAGGQAVAYELDIADEAAVKRVIESIVERFGSLDIAHNNAGMAGIAARLDEWDVSMFEKVLDVNTVGTFACMKYELAQMLKQGGGSIINTASTAGMGGTPMMSGYVASKHAVVGLTKTAAVDYAKDNIRVNAVCPASTRTPMIMDWIGGDKAMEAMHNASQPIGRMGLPEEVGSAVLWLGSDASSFITGVILPVDGGQTAVVGGGK